MAADSMNPAAGLAIPRRATERFALERFTEAEAVRGHAFTVPVDFRLDDEIQSGFDIYGADVRDAHHVDPTARCGSHSPVATSRRRIVGPRMGPCDASGRVRRRCRERAGCSPCSLPVANDERSAVIAVY
jgi:hypothetical protein